MWKSSLVARALAVATLGLLPVTASSSSWMLDTAHTSIGFKVKHLMVSNVKGSFETFSGTVVLDEEDVTRSSVEVTADAKSIDTNNPDRDNHLRSPDFFDVEKFPQMTFKSTKIVKAGDDRLKVIGDLTLHGVTKSIELDVRDLTPPIEAMGTVRRGLSASGSLDRRDFGLTWNKAIETGGVLVGNEVEINLEVELIRMEDTPKTGQVAGETK